MNAFFFMGLDRSRLTNLCLDLDWIDLLIMNETNITMTSANAAAAVIVQYLLWLRDQAPWVGMR